MKNYEQNVWRQAGMLSVFVILFSASAGFCDDGYIQVYGGGAKLQNGEHPDISMDSETVKIELGTSTYVVDAEFSFFNHGPSTSVMVGFPQVGEAGGPAGMIVGLLKELRPKDFETWVNGVRYEVKEMPGEVFLDDKKTEYNSAEDLYEKKLKQAEMAAASDKSGESEVERQSVIKEARWLVKEVPFAGNTSTLVRVRYTAAAAYQQLSPMADYIYGTGRSWKGGIGSIKFIIKASSDAWVSSISFASGAGGPGRKYKTGRLSEYEYEYLLTGVEPAEDEKLHIAIGQGLDGPQQWESAMLWPEGEGRKRYKVWKYSSAPVPQELLKTLSLRQLKFLRNTFYAGHGRVFKDPELRKYFEERGGEYNWYAPRSGFKESDLSEVERRNVLKIAEYEKELRKTLISAAE